MGSCFLSVVDLGHFSQKDGWPANGTAMNQTVILVKVSIEVIKSDT